MTTKCPAEERLLDLALEEVLAGAPPVPRPRPSRLLLIASLCSIAVVVALAWQHRGSGFDTATRQEPGADLPTPVRVASLAELRALPADTKNLEARFPNPAELRELLRFRDLRRLCVLPPVASPPIGAGAEAHRAFDEQFDAATTRYADPATFAPLASLRTLESLELPGYIAWTPEHFAFLRDLHLQDLRIWMLDLRTRPMIEALLGAPTFRSLRLAYCQVGVDLFTTLEPLRLRRLELCACSGLGDAEWATVAKLRTLRHLEVTRSTSGATRLGETLHRTDSLGDAAFDAFAALPELQRLELHESEFPGDLLLRLPTTLVDLDLGSRSMTWGEARMLRRLTGLRSLGFGNDLQPETAAPLLATWELEALRYRGALHGPILAAIAAQPRLTKLSLLCVQSRTDLAPLASAPQLQDLRLHTPDWQPPSDGIPVAQLAPLVRCPKLHTLHISAPTGDLEAIRKLFEARVTVTLDTEF